MSKFSTKEIYLFTELGMREELDFIDNKILSISPMRLYDFAIRKVFIEELTGNAVDSLRRCIKAIDTGEYSRNSLSFDELIQL